MFTGTEAAPPAFPPMPPSPLSSSSALARFVLVSVLALLAAHLVDRWAFVHLMDEGFGNGDLGRMLRILGFLGTWAVASVALVLHDWPLHRTHSRYLALSRGLLLFAGATAGGIAAELLKLLFRRERPRAHAGEYVFREFTERPFSTGGLAFPSSHALVAFGAAFMLARIFPRARWVWYALGVGCAVSRVAAGAHFVSDVVFSGIVGFLVVALIWRAHLRRLAPTEDPPSGAVQEARARVRHA